MERDISPDWRSRVAGAVLGAAIGDAMGHPTEFLGWEAIRQTFPPGGVTEFELWWERDGARFAPYTDDTQMAEIVLRTLLDARSSGLDLDGTMSRMAEGFVEWSVSPQGGHRSPGNACMAGARSLANGAHWSEAGGTTAGGCGSVTRAYPFGLVFAGDPAKAEAWAVEHSRMTHRDPGALAACAAMARGMALAVAGASVDDVLEGLEAAAKRHDFITASLIGEALDDVSDGIGPERTLTQLEGWAAHEAIAAAAYVVARHPSDIRAAILEGANAHGDSDSIATLAGALLGAMLGVEALPDDWIRDVERSAELTVLAERIYA